ncbi:MAG: hypothetical protein DME45_04610 [Verrucomicrobia bacterium]|nr:MAG: hypothetical protein DME45_04610 [Verrucomicrobiota bacterium]
MAEFLAPGCGLGSARVSRVGFGVTPKRAFLISALNGLIGRCGKFAKTGTLSPARETRALPGKDAALRDWLERANFR